MDEPRNGGDPYMTVREMVMEIRADVKALADIVATLTPVVETVKDHEERIREVETSTAKWKYGIPPALIGSIGALLAALFGVRAN